MKTTIMHLMSLFLVLAFAASCGKKEGGSSGSNNAGNPLLTNPSLDVSTQQNYQAVRAWYDNAATDNRVSRALFIKETKSINSSNGSGFNFSGALCFGSLIQVGNCQEYTQTKPTGCLTRIGAHVFTGTPVIQNNSVMGCTQSGAHYEKANNAELTRAITGNGLKLFSVHRLSNSNYVLGYGPEGYYSPTTYFEIDTSTHSALNPVGIQENSKITKTLHQTY